jgi:transcription antitermination factor NusG
MKWYVLYTRHHHERAVYERLLGKRFQSYLPLAMVWRKSKGAWRRVATPLFPRHVFVRCYLDMYAHLELISIPGVMRLLEDAQGQPLILPEEEMRLLRRLSDSGAFIEQGKYETQGERVEVVQGQLRGISGVLRDAHQAILLVPLPTLQVSVALEISRIQVAPYADNGEDLRGGHFLPDSLLKGNPPAF